MTACAVPIETSPPPARPFSRRGACPSLATPMQTGDGLLVRLRPLSPGLSPRALVALAEAGRCHGNGIVEITARGNIQLRGLHATTVPLLAGDIAAAGIELAKGVAIETPGLAGVDPAEIADPLPLAAALRHAIVARNPPLILAPKLANIVDGGGRLHLGDTVADIRLRAVHDGDGIRWLLALGGTDRTARRVSMLDEEDVVSAVVGILEMLSAAGPHMRGRDLDAAGLPAASHSMEVPPLAAAPLPAGRHVTRGGAAVLGLGLAFGQTETENLVAFLRDIETLGASEVRPVAGHGLLILGIPEASTDAALASAIARGFRISADDPGNTIAVCAGSGACASALMDTKHLAQLVIDTAPELLDGSFVLHVSGCAKGCARASASALTLVGAPTGHGLVVNGAASAAPNGYIDEKDVEAAIGKLGALVRNQKHAGESALSCLTRLGAEQITAAVQQG